MQANYDTGHGDRLAGNRKHRLERERSRLVQELARVNKLLRRREPAVGDNDDWDFDPRGVAGEVVL
jgi:hypothetical protein